MDAARSILLGLLTGLGASCAAWSPESAAPNATLQPLAEPLAEADLPRCDDAPSVVASGGRVLVIGACQTRVALFRRDVVAGGATSPVGVCTLPCADDTAGPGVVAYTTRAIAPSGALGPDSPETYVTVEPHGESRPE